MLETHIRGANQALLGNLRAFPPRGTANEVWNHGIYKYIAKYHAIPGKGPRAVRLKVEIHANSGSCLNGQDDKPRLSPTSTRWSTVSTARWTRPIPGPPTGSRWEARRCSPPEHPPTGRNDAGRAITRWSPRPTSGPSTWPTAAATAASSQGRRRSSGRSATTRRAGGRCSPAATTRTIPPASGTRRRGEHFSGSSGADRRVAVLRIGSPASCPVPGNCWVLPRQAPGRGVPLQADRLSLLHNLSRLDRFFGICSLED